MSGIQTDLIAVAFAAILKDWLSPEEWTAMRQANARHEYASGICASHNYCDANMAMAPAFALVTGHEANVSSEADSVLWSSAWELAKDKYLTEGGPGA